MSKEHRVVGPPGTGKTTYLSRQCPMAISKYGARGVAIASLTRAAAKEIASRSTGLPPANIGTLHAHAYRRLDRPELAETSKGVHDWNEKCGVAGWRLTSRSVANPENASSDEVGGWGDDGGDSILAELGVLRARVLDERSWPMRVRGFWKRWQQWKDDSGRIDFTDLIIRALDEVDDLDVSVLMLDEAQDMSRLEMKLARKWGAEAEQLVVCGDPDQNLYEWRGSDPDAFYDADAASSRVLAQSYRVPSRVHAAAVEWIEQIPGRTPVEYRPRGSEGRVARHSGVCVRDSGSLRHLTEELGADGSSVMILASCGYMVAEVCRELKAAAIPFHNPYRVTNGQWNPLLGARRLMAFLRPRRDAWGEDARLWSWDEVRLWTEPMVAKDTIKRGMKSWIESKARGGKFDDEEDRLVDSLLDVLQCFESEHWEDIVSHRIDWWLKRLRHDDQRRQAYVCDVALRRGPGVLHEMPKVIVGTIHSVKGGEADKVVLSPDLSRAGIEDWMGRGRDAITRMFYVGMTRAREELHILGPSGEDYAPI